MKNFNDIKFMDHAKLLFPICRSLTGEGTRKTLNYFEKFNPELNRLKFKSGEKVFDWEIPLEWNINDAYIQNINTGKKYAEFKKNNLHIVGYSIPLNDIFSLDELQSKIYTIKDHPNWIPYVTSYYKKDWGFCLEESVKSNLPKGKYKVYIDSTLKKGSLDLDYALLKGHYKKEILISSYICHPSMANNELSGPLVLNAVLDYIKNKYKNLRFSYRLVLAPETVGTIAFISKFEKDLKKNVICGINLSCVGDERSFSFVKTPYGTTLADDVMRAALVGKENKNEYSFMNRGSDERQYCSPLINLPVCTFSKSLFGKYPEYHTSKDNLELITEKGLKESLDVVTSIIDGFESCLYPIINVKCEPQLGKRNLYQDLSIVKKGKHFGRSTLDVIAYCNGENSIFDISNLTQIPLKEVTSQIEVLKRNSLISDNIK